MSDKHIFYSRGIPFTLEEIKADVEAAKNKGLTGRHAFTPETVEALVVYIEMMEEHIQSRSQVWDEAFAAFKGAFDTPLARRRQSDEYSVDARQRLHQYNSLMKS